jgi:hypothetical protein
LEQFGRKFDNDLTGHGDSPAELFRIMGRAEAKAKAQDAVSNCWRKVHQNTMTGCAINRWLGTPHTIPTIVAQIAVPIPHRDRPAVVAARGVELKAGELLAADGRAVAVHLQNGRLARAIGAAAGVPVGSGARAGR